MRLRHDVARSRHNLHDPSPPYGGSPQLFSSKLISVRLQGPRRCPRQRLRTFAPPPPGQGWARFHGWRGSSGRPSAPTGFMGRCPNCSLVLTAWQGAQRQRTLSSVSGPPMLSGTMWSGTVAATTRPCSAQSRHSGSARRRRSLCSTPFRPLARWVPLAAMWSGRRAILVSSPHLVGGCCGQANQTPVACRESQSRCSLTDVGH